MSSVLAMAKELVLAQIRAGHLSLDAMHTLLQETYAHLMALKAHEEGSSLETMDERAVVPAPVPWKKSITKHAVTCLECGTSFKQLSRRHLKLHDLDLRAYRARFGEPARKPLPTLPVPEKGLPKSWRSFNRHIRRSVAITAVQLRKRAVLWRQ